LVIEHDTAELVEAFKKIIIAKADEAIITLKNAQDDYDKISEVVEKAEFALEAAESKRLSAVKEAYDASEDRDIPSSLVVSLRFAILFAFEAFKNAEAYYDETLVADKNARLKLEAAKLNVTSTQAEVDEFNVIVPKLAIKSIATLAANRAADMTDKADNLAVHAEVLAKKEEEARASVKKATNAVFKNGITNPNITFVNLSNTSKTDFDAMVSANDAETIATKEALVSKAAADEAKVTATAAKFRAMVAADMVAKAFAEDD
jgi:hypothetical protein